uniref:sulfatase-like hydrolase/transferase n=1 Tax=Rosenbergiella nectarea TaxID=988801 RepID=UPI001F4E7454
VISLQDQECGDLILTTAKSSIYSTTPHRTYNMSKENKKSFVMMYFSDHGMTVDNSDRPVRHGNTEKQNYHVPFFVLADDLTEHTQIDTPISAFQFINIFGYYAGITSQQINPINVLDTKPKNIQVFNGTEMVDYQGLSNSTPLY